MNQSEVVEKAREFLAKFNPDGLIPFPFEATINTLGDISITYYETPNSEINGAIYLADGIYHIVINTSKPQDASILQLHTNLAIIGCIDTY